MHVRSPDNKSTSRDTKIHNKYRSGIERDKTMDDKSIYIPNDDELNYLLCQLKKLVENCGHT